jgi:hypothetical protein
MSSSNTNGFSRSTRAEDQGKSASGSQHHEGQPENRAPERYPAGRVFILTTPHRKSLRSSSDGSQRLLRQTGRSQRARSEKQPLISLTTWKASA